MLKYRKKNNKCLYIQADNKEITKCPLDTIDDIYKYSDILSDVLIVC